MLISDMKNIPPRTAKALEKKKIITAIDLARLMPKKYMDFREVKDIISEKELEKTCAVKGKMVHCALKPGNHSDYIFIRIMTKNEKPINVFLFGRQFMLEKYMRMKGEYIVVCGKISYDERYGYSMNAIYMERVDDFMPRIMVEYPKLKNISENNLKTIISDTYKLIPDYLPETIVKENGLMSLSESLEQVHAPTDCDHFKQAMKRLTFDDLLYFSVMFYDEEEKSKTDIKFPEHNMLKEYINTLPFECTDDQKKAIKNIAHKTAAGMRVNALVQGDVGSGKTVVAISSMLLACDNGYQSVLMAPREVLARQHYEEVTKYADKLGIKTVFLHSGMKAAEKKQAKKGIESGEIKVIVGTHACISDDNIYHNLGIVITDEEHLFGVKQKQKLTGKAKNVHYISMSATPIPRTLATALYGDKKEIIQIKTMPKGRIPVSTSIMQNRQMAFEFMLNEVKKGHQCYVVCPAIEDGENPELLVSIEQAEKFYRARFEAFGYRIGIVNGKMKKEEVENEIDAFKDNRSQVLISTTVIEVGVNVPNATVMVIEQADRFGMASLHQLRGRVGRSSLPSYCILLANDTDNERLTTIASTTDGFEIAEADMQQRGSGNLIGLEQSGLNKYLDAVIMHPDIFEQAKNTMKKYRNTVAFEEIIRKYSEGA